MNDRRDDMDFTHLT